MAGTSRGAARVVRAVPATILAVVLGAGLLLWPWVDAVAPDDGGTEPELVRITDYRAEFAVDRAGRLRATETITATFPPDRHGIFRFWDVADRGDEHVRHVPEDIQVTRDGRPEPTSLSWQTGHTVRVARIGDADTLLPAGSHVYVVRYAVDGALAPRGQGGDTGAWVADSASGSALVWDLVPSGWRMPIDRARLSVDLPVAPDDVACRIGAGQRPCRVSRDGATLDVRATDLAPNTRVAVRAELDLPAPDRSAVPWSPSWDGVLGRSQVWLGVLLLLVAAGFALGRWWVGRADEEDPGRPVMYAPPEGLGPVQAHYVAHERIPGDALVATLLHQAERGLTRLERVGDKHWRIEGLGTSAQWMEADPVSRMVATRLGVDTPGHLFEADGSVTSGQTLQAVQKDLGGLAEQWAVNDGLVVAVASERRHRVLVVLAAVAGIALALTHPFGATVVAAPALALVIGGAGLFTVGVGTRRTPRGREVWARSAGFRRLLSTPSAEDRFDFSARKDAYTAYIPYAVAFGCAEAWAEKYRRTVGEEPPHPAWYPVTTSGGGWLGGHDGGLGSFESSLQSSISAYQATQSSSSSGGGGGFSGGGGGGGGSW